MNDYLPKGLHVSKYLVPALICAQALAASRIGKSVLTDHEFDIDCSHSAAAACIESRLSGMRSTVNKPDMSARTDFELFRRAQKGSSEDLSVIFSGDASGGSSSNRAACADVSGDGVFNISFRPFMNAAAVAWKVEPAWCSSLLICVSPVAEPER